MRMPSHMKHDFSKVASAEIQRSTFDLTHTHKTTFSGGDLIPFYTEEILPGDSFNCSANLFGRLITPAVPIIDNLYLDYFFFFIPNRLVWDNWTKFCGETDDPYDPDVNANDYEIPQLVAGVSGFAEGSLADYFGMQIKQAGISVSSLYHRAYNRVYNEWFRCEYIQDSLVVDMDDSAITESDYVVRKRNKRADYFTTALPWPQRGPGVELPLGTQAPISGIVVSDSASKTWNTSGCHGVLGQDISGNTWSFSSGGIGIRGLAGNVNQVDMYADLSEATAATINSLREAFQLQRLYERDALGGARYCELLVSHFHVYDPMHAVLQRTQYLGGGSSAVLITPVAQTSVDSTNPQGHLAAFGTIAAHGGFNKSFTEHGILLGLCSLRSELTYQQGIDRKFSRLTRFDYYWPALAHLGEQAVLNKEIYAQAEPTYETENNGVFGYQERYAEYRYARSLITGRLRSTATTPLDVWHLAQEFDSLPTLSEAFIQENPPIDRVTKVTTEPHVIMDSYIKVKATRPMPCYSTPGWTDHF